MRVVVSRQSDGRLIALLLHGKRPWVTLDMWECVRLDVLRLVVWVIGGDSAPSIESVVYVARETLHPSLLPAEGVDLSSIARPNDFARWLRGHEGDRAINGGSS